MGNYSSNNQQQQQDNPNKKSLAVVGSVQSFSDESDYEMFMSNKRGLVASKSDQNLNAKTDTSQSTNGQEMNEQDMKMLLHTFDAFINHVLQEKLSKIKSDSQTGTPPATNKLTGYGHYYKEPSTKVLFDNLAQMLSTHLDDYLAACKRTGIVTALTYKSCTGTENNFHHHHAGSIPGSVSNSNNMHEQSTLAINTYCPAPASTQSTLPNIGDLNKCYLNHSSSNHTTHQHYLNNTKLSSIDANNRRRMSLNNANHQHFISLSSHNNKNCLAAVQQQFQCQSAVGLGSSPATSSSSSSSSSISENKMNNLNNLLQPDSIRINLPEILDQQDEITILRLLIKLLSGKVRKLNDENRYLLQQISVLNDINIELAGIVQHKFQK